VSAGHCSALTYTNARAHTHSHTKSTFCTHTHTHTHTHTAVFAHLRARPPTLAHTQWVTCASAPFSRLSLSRVFSPVYFRAHLLCLQGNGGGRSGFDIIEGHPGSPYCIREEVGRAGLDVCVSECVHMQPCSQARARDLRAKCVDARRWLLRAGSCARGIFARQRERERERERARERERERERESYIRNFHR